jgi:hypothetical protein
LRCEGFTGGVILSSHFGKTRARLSALTILASSAATTLTPGRADPQAVNFPEPMVVCKTHRELNELVEALRISLKAYDAKLKQLGVDPSECDVNTVSHVFVLESDDLGVVDFNLTQRRVWIVHFTNAAKDGWGLYEEAAAPIASIAAAEEGPTIACSNRRWSMPASVGVNQARAVCWRGETETPRLRKPGRRCRALGRGR